MTQSFEGHYIRAIGLYAVNVEIVRHRALDWKGAQPIVGIMSMGQHAHELLSSPVRHAVLTL